MTVLRQALPTAQALSEAGNFARPCCTCERMVASLTLGTPSICPFVSPWQRAPGPIPRPPRVPRGRQRPQSL